MFYVGIAIVIAAIIVVCVLSASSQGKKLGPVAICGAIVGTLVGGASTIGTAQLAFDYGLSGWLYTLGAGLGIFILLPYFRPLKERNLSTVSDIVDDSYGHKCANVFTYLVIAGSFLSLISQVMSGSALLQSILPLSNTICIVLICVLIFTYVVFGGVAALAKAGAVKVILLVLGSIGCGILAIVLCGGFKGFSVLDPKLYSNLFARGIGKDLSSLLSVFLGLAVSQNYLVVVVNAKSRSDLKLGLLLTAIVTPLIGLGGVFIGKYMRIAYPDIEAKLAFPMFLRTNLSPFLAGIMFAVLIITIMGSGAGITYGITNLIKNNVFKQEHKSSDKFVETIILIVIISLAAILCLANLANLILTWTFLSMALRGAIGFVPVFFGLFTKKQIKPNYVIVSMFAALAVSIFGNMILPANIDSLFVALSVSFIICMLGLEK